MDNEIDVAKDLARQEGKPEEMPEKIAMGRLNKFFKENTLLNQEFIKESKTSVSQYLNKNRERFNGHRLQESRARSLTLIKSIKRVFFTLFFCSELAHYEVQENSFKN